jgi:hypothetical protein
MSAEIPKSPFMDRLRESPKFKKMPAKLRSWFSEYNINDPETVINYLCLGAQHVLSRNAKPAAINILELAEEFASETKDEHLVAQINAWIGLIEEGDQQLIQETIEAIREVIKIVSINPEFHITK